jgi:hypothetical protein
LKRTSNAEKPCKGFHHESKAAGKPAAPSYFLRFSAYSKGEIGYIFLRQSKSLILTHPARLFENHPSGW